MLLAGPPSVTSCIGPRILNPSIMDKSVLSTIAFFMSGIVTRKKILNRLDVSKLAASVYVEGMETIDA